MASKELMDMLNEAIANELQVSIQYMWQHVTVPGIHSEAVGGICPPLTVVRQPARQVGKKAASILLDLISGNPVTETEFYFNCDLVIERTSS